MENIGSETPRTNALQMDLVGASYVKQAAEFMRHAKTLERQVIATQKELNDLRLTMMRNSELFSDNILRAVNATNRAEKAEQALALRGEPVAKEAIVEIADRHVRQLWDTVLDIDFQRGIFESAILEALALYAAPISGEREDDQVLQGVERQDYTGGPVYRVSHSTGTAAISGERASMPCEDCNGEGWVGEAQYQSEFQPPERERCESCGGSGRWPAVSGERVREALPISEVSIPMTEVVTTPCQGCGKRPIDFISGDALPLAAQPEGK